MNIKFLCLAALLVIFKATAQEKKEVFSEKSRKIGEKIGFISRTQKDSLKIEVQKLDSLYNNGKLTKSEWETKKLERAEFRAKRIEELVSKEDEKLLNLTKGLVTGEVRLDPPATKLQEFASNFPPIRFNVAFGPNNLIENGDFSTLGDSEIKNFRSYFVEWGFNYRIPLVKAQNYRLFTRAGFSVIYNNLYPTSGKYFKKESEITKMVTDNEISKNRFKNVYLTFPLHLEYDLGKRFERNGRTFYEDLGNFRIGVGGFIGTHLKTKNFFRRNDDRVLQKYDFNTSDFVYGLSAYLGYKGNTLYFKYDLNPLFENNTPKQNIVSLGIRFDL